ncbi:Beclin-1 [Phytophthora boehmeriae]|uniref:Beclin-1 n=1 Tax=Phytophthora boehmeriae TaxID=109152 RepID=A0A8T1X060_9STRA|nr:Beclin-1 [Phytophthora boehmeriae]
MATRGVNGAASRTLNERFIKCEGCRVNVPKEDMLALGKCTVCGRVYEVVVTADGRGIEVETVAFGASSGAAAAAEKAPKRKRWAVLQSRKGRMYYHNTETGEDRWDKPADIEADAVEDAFVPFKNDAVKKAVLREQAKLEATKMGVPIEVVAATQQKLQLEDEAEDPLNRMVERGSRSRNVPTRDSPKKKSVAPVQDSDQVEEEDPQHLGQDTSKTGGSCAVM